ncbi:MAG: glutathione synthase [Alteromonadaceae bacterium]|nr:MAG: glutathione synthase [Alteromonadaceae bacterium]
MNRTLGVVMDPIADIKYHKDTTLALLLAAQQAGFTLEYMEIDDLYLLNGEAKASARKLRVIEDKNRWYELDDAREVALKDIDVMLMRKDPPFDNQYIYATYILEEAEKSGTLVVNKPQSLRDCNEKVFATQFPECCPPVLVSRKTSLLKSFHQEHGDVIFKPLDGMGGTGIFRCRADDPNVSVIIETLSEYGNSFIMVQKFIPEISNGDKRVLMVNGVPIPYALARIPAEGETRGNIAAGGRGVAQTLSERDLWIAAQIGPTLVRKGLFFVGLDIIGDYLTEINVTSPTCVQEIDAAYDTKIGAKLMQAICDKLAEDE